MAAPSTAALLKELGLASPRPTVAKSSSTPTATTQSQAAKKTTSKSQNTYSSRGFHELLAEAASVTANEGSNDRGRDGTDRGRDGTAQRPATGSRRSRSHSHTTHSSTTRGTSQQTVQPLVRSHHAQVLRQRHQLRARGTRPASTTPGATTTRHSPTAAVTQRLVRQRATPVISSDVSVASLSRLAVGANVLRARHPERYAPRQSSVSTSHTTHHNSTESDSESSSSSRSSMSRRSRSRRPPPAVRSERDIDELAHQGDYRAAVRAIFARNRPLPSRPADSDSDDDLRDMEVSASQILREESRSSRIARREDAVEEARSRRV